MLDPRFASAALATVPLMLLGSLAMAAPAEAAQPDVAPKRSGALTLQSAFGAVAKVRAAVSSTAVPSTYKVQAGDTVSSIAQQYGLSTASVLALNGLGWKSLIFPGQVLKLSKAKASPDAVGSASSYTVSSGDTVSAIATRFGVSIAALLKSNGLSTKSIIYPGQTVEVPAASKIDATPVASVTTARRTVATSYVVATGDTVSSIAARFGVSVQSVLSENGLDASSILYPGTALTIPTLSVYIPGTGTVTLLDANMTTNARTIIRVGRQLGVSDRGIVVALAAAMQESALSNIDYGDLDSVGLFQQRPSQGWGTESQLLDTTYATRLFFGGPTGPNSDETPGLLDIPGWSSMTITQAAQAVQVSAFPEAYAQWETSARYWLAELG